MWLIVLGALVGAGIVAWKLIELSVKLGRAQALLERADALVARRMIAEAHALARDSNTPAGRALNAGLARRGAGPHAVAQAIANAEMIESAHLERGLVALAAIASIAPLFGALEAVLAALEIVRTNGGVLPSGVAAPLLTPIGAGLALAIAASLVHMWLASRIEAFAADVRRSARAAVDALEAMYAEPPDDT